MKILVPTAGPMPAMDKAEYVINIAKRLRAEVIALHILHEEDRQKGEEALNIFAEAGQKADVKVAKILKKGGLVSSIVDSAEKETATLIIMGASEGKVVTAWVSKDVMERTKTPVLVLPHEIKKTI